MHAWQPRSTRIRYQLGVSSPRCVKQHFRQMMFQFTEIVDSISSWQGTKAVMVMCSGPGQVELSPSVSLLLCTRRCTCWWPSCLWCCLSWVWRPVSGQLTPPLTPPPLTPPPLTPPPLTPPPLTLPPLTPPPLTPPYTLPALTPPLTSSHHLTAPLTTSDRPSLSSLTPHTVYCLFVCSA